ncbi:MAG: GlyGly-CTERM sorting domain-containing protein [Shewanella sp.]
MVKSDGIEPKPPTPPTPPVKDESKDSGGGSLSWLAIALLGLIATSRQKWHKLR